MHSENFYESKLYLYFNFYSVKIQCLHLKERGKKQCMKLKICLEKQQLLLSNITNLGFPGGSDSKESACNAGDLGSVPGWGRSPGGGHSNPLQYSCLENPHGQRSLGSYSPWSCKESDTAKRLSTAEHITSPSTCMIQNLI